MKILYITHEYMGRRVRYGRELEALGHDVKIITLKNKRTGSITSATFGNAKFDLIFLFSVQYFSTVIEQSFIDYAKSNAIPIASYSIISTSTPLEQWAKNFERVDYPFIVNQPTVERLRGLGIKARYLPFGYYADLYYPKRTGKKKYDVTFMGHLQGNTPREQDLRANTINGLIAKKIPIKVWGRDPEQRLKIKATAYSGHAAQNDIYNQSAINLDFPWVNTTLADYKDLLHMKNRFIEIPGSGGFLLTKRCDEFEEILHDQQHCVYYDDFEDLVDKIRYYLNNNREREKIASQGHKRVKNNFQFKHLLDKVIQTVKRGTRGAAR